MIKNYEAFSSDIYQKALPQFIERMFEKGLSHTANLEKMAVEGNEENGLPSLSGLMSEYFIAEAIKIGTPPFIAERFAKYAMEPSHQLMLCAELIKRGRAPYFEPDQKYYADLILQCITSPQVEVADAARIVLRSSPKALPDVLERANHEDMKSSPMFCNPEWVRSVFEGLPHRKFANLLGSSWRDVDCAKSIATYDFFVTETDGGELVNVHAINYVLLDEYPLVAVSDPVSLVKDFHSKGVELSFGALSDAVGSKSNWSLDTSLWSLSGPMVEFKKIFMRVFELERLLAAPELLRWFVVEFIDNEFSARFGPGMKHTALDSMTSQSAQKAHRHYLKQIANEPPSEALFNNVITCATLFARTFEQKRKVKAGELSQRYIDVAVSHVKSLDQEFVQEVIGRLEPRTDIKVIESLKKAITSTLISEAPLDTDPTAEVDHFKPY